ncbi:hypothetical protein D9758_003700 [Tetrapyrgos nigripes]|uniref:Uncharacterized protein n=1 Tax=Tetrapyrgos nigripes TaxID=182062 RepID=A0A8H5LRM1_9AGAR|nr:hypothetical protein D9758_003700 [Tetrapyrgos nigripes]
MELFVFDHVPDNKLAYAALFSPVANPAEIKKRIIDASKIEGEDGDKERDAVNFAFIDASLVCPAPPSAQSSFMKCFFYSWTTDNKQTTSGNSHSPSCTR